jgi:hypothetical protein
MTNKIIALLPFIEDQKWRLDAGRLIRNKKGQCPVCAIIDVLSRGKIVYTLSAGTAWKEYFGDKTRDEDEDLVNIVDAADIVYHHPLSKTFRLRQELLKSLIHAE